MLVLHCCFHVYLAHRLHDEFQVSSLGGTFGNIPFDINNKGQVVGQSDLPGDTVHHGFFWENGKITDVGSLPGLPMSVAPWINNQRRVVGFSKDANGDDSSSVAFLWQNGVLTDLNALIPAGSSLFLMEAVAINDHGQIAGWGRPANGDIRPFLLTPCQVNVEGPTCQNTVETTAIVPYVSPRSLTNFEKSIQNRWVRSLMSAKSTAE